MRLFKYEIQFKTFFKKGLKKIDDHFGVYYVTGKQGSGKNYFATSLVDRQPKKLVNKIYTNVHSLKIPNCKMCYFSTLEEIWNNTEEHCIFVIDEVSKRYNKNSKTDTKFVSWLYQSRKRKRIVIMITQEWRELPMWLRRPAKYMFTTQPAKLLNIFGIYKTIWGDAENLVFDKDEGEYTCPTLLVILYKRNTQIASMYDTFESVPIL